jgi:hypothetical protein
MNRNEKAIAIAETDPRSASTLIPMLVGGLVLIVVGMIAVAVLS